MTIIEYKLHPSPNGMVTPDFVNIGGGFHNPDDCTLVGIIEDGVEYYVPDTLTILTLEELQARQRGIHAKYPMTDTYTPFGTLSDEEVDQIVADWVTERTNA